MSRFASNRLIALITALSASAATGDVVRAQRVMSAEDANEAAAVRVELSAEYVKWGKARVDLDRASFERTLVPDFYVEPSLGAPRVNRADFIESISRSIPGVKLVRLDSDILTLQHEADGTWIAVITEKLEGDRVAPDGSPRHTASLWITRDAWRKVDGQWRIAFSEGIGVEFWPSGHPPFADWNKP